MSASRSADRWHEDQADLPAGMAYFISTLRSARAVVVVHLMLGLDLGEEKARFRRARMHMSARNSGATTRSRSLCRPSLGMAGFRAEVGRMASR